VKEVLLPLPLPFIASLVILPPFAATESTVQAASTLAVLLGTVLLVAVATRYVHVPYTVALVVAGLALGLVGGAFAVPLTEDLILVVFLPALLFEAGYNLPWARLRAEIRFVNALAIPGVLTSTAIVGAIVHVAGLRWPVALLFGALISATDPVSVLATFRQLGTNQRLSIIVEGESLFNDGTALVVFRLVLGVILGGSVSVFGTGVAFVVSIVGGILLGLGVGYLVTQSLRRIDDYLLEISVTLLVTYGLFILAEQVHATALGVDIGASPVIAVVVFGLVMGNYASRESMSPATRISMHGAWELISYLANSLIFLLIGLQINHTTFHIGDLRLIFGAIIGVLVSRAVIVYGITSIVNARTPPARRLPLNFLHLINWGGLRGAVAIASALSIPAARVPERGIILLLTFAVVFFTLIVQGLTIRPLVDWLGLKRNQSAQLVAFERLQGQIVAVQAARRALRTMLDTGEVTDAIYHQIADAYSERADTLAQSLAGLQVSTEELRAGQLRVAERKVLQAEKAALLSLRARGVITEGVFRSLTADANLRLLALETPGEGHSVEEIITPGQYDERTVREGESENAGEVPITPLDYTVPPTLLETEAAPLIPPQT